MWTVWTHHVVLTSSFVIVASYLDIVLVEMFNILITGHDFQSSINVPLRTLHPHTTHETDFEN